MADESKGNADATQTLTIGGRGADAANGAHGHGDIERFRHCVDEYIAKADELELKVNKVVDYYTSIKQPNNSKGIPRVTDKDKKKSGVANKTGISNNNEEKKLVGSRRMQELMRQFGTIMKQITQLKWAEPFMDPVDVEGLGLHDYYEVIEKPMDFGTIKKQMEAKDDSGYKNVREIYADVRLVFANAMKYNGDRNQIHIMAKILLEKFENKWLQLLPKVVEEEEREKEVASQAPANTLIDEEAAYMKMAEDTNIELDELNLHLEEIKELVIQNCRKLSIDERRDLAAGLAKLSTEDIFKVIDIIAESNPGNNNTPSETVDIDMDAQNRGLSQKSRKTLQRPTLSEGICNCPNLSQRVLDLFIPAVCTANGPYEVKESTLWKLKFFLKGALELQEKSSAGKAGDNLKRKKAICAALAKTDRKRCKKLSSL